MLTVAELEETPYLSFFREKESVIEVQCSSAMASEWKGYAKRGLGK